MTDPSELIKSLYAEAIRLDGSSLSGLLIRAGDEILKLNAEITTLQEQTSKQNPLATTTRAAKG